MKLDLAKKKAVVRKSNGRFASEENLKMVGDKHETTSDSGYVDNNLCKNRGEVMSHSRVIYNHKCDFCGHTFEGIATAKFCSNACRQKQKRLKKTIPTIGMICEWKSEKNKGMKGKILNITPSKIYGVFENDLPFDWSYDKFLHDFNFWME